MNFEVDESIQPIRDTVRRFVDRELIPIESWLIRRETERGFAEESLLPPDVEQDLRNKARDAGLFGIDVPAEYGGQDLGMFTKCIVFEEMRRSIVPFHLPPQSPNLSMLQALCTGTQIEDYLLPYAAGEKTSCIAVTEPGAGSDIAGIKTRAERRDGKWLINGNKLWITDAKRVDFIVLIAVTDAEKGTRGGLTAFLLDQGTPGVSYSGPYPVIGEQAPYGVALDDVVLDDSKVLGEVGGAFIPLSKRLGVRRMEIAARCVGLATRCLSMMIEQAHARKTFGSPLADRQTVQWWIADSYQEIEMVRLVNYRLALGMESSADPAAVRRDGSLVKVQATEMLTRVVDRAIQLFGAMGLSKELPLEYIARLARVFRVVEGPSEIHRWVLARELLKSGLPQ
jgi:(R)-benzylsuccinyl-CoA dehydrogenase